MITYHTHTLPGSDEGCNADHETNGRQNSPAPPGATQNDENSGKDARNNPTDSKTASENHTWSIAVADGPANEVGVRLMSQRPLHGSKDSGKGRWVCGVCEGVKESCPLLGGEIQLARGTIGNIRRNDPRYLLSEWLDGDCHTS